MDLLDVPICNIVGALEPRLFSTKLGYSCYPDTWSLSLVTEDNWRTDFPLYTLDIAGHTRKTNKANTAQRQGISPSHNLCDVNDPVSRAWYNVQLPKYNSCGNRMHRSVQTLTHLPPEITNHITIKHNFFFKHGLWEMTNISDGNLDGIFNIQCPIAVFDAVLVQNDSTWKVVCNRSLVCLDFIEFSLRTRLRTVKIAGHDWRLD